MLEFWADKAIMTLKVKVNDPNFQYHPKEFWEDAYFIKLHHSKSNPLQVIAQTNQIY